MSNTKMRTTVSKWGNSAAVRLPRDLLERGGLAINDEVEIEQSGDGLLIRRVRPAPAYDLAKLVERITEDNRHAEVSWGQPEGEETE
ncbi:AbrB/MazE/SpoVT family DNA-binding domain-containing protein [Nitrococcus mobilis]|uniref:PemI-like suppressor of inhibitory function of ChpA n=1 Tax=Nitrococcus mobilis Nb-231 TaxID=314278 RepID=A4BMA5_9GAMM|nr:AbrB/MazE/SpoVT family DNA-binding domain-containing protein [Nitrococcus mobilis]EAR23443.1 PemI-like suppressor of inhibitory function of ChpA [Nitrococcus mobilis Nb-231]